MHSNPLRGFRLRILGVCVFLLAVVVVFIPDKYRRSFDQLFSLGKFSENRMPLETKTDRSADSLSKNRLRSPSRDPKEWFAEVIARNPGLEPVWKNVPDHENGFLQWLEFCEKYRVDEGLGTEKLDIPEDIAEMISKPEKWDSQAVKAFLDKNKDLLAAISRIGLLPSQSAAGIDMNRWSFVGARFTKQSADLLLADARLAAENGDLEHALRRVRAACGLDNHYDQIETPTLLMAAVSIVVRLNTQDQVIKHFLPTLNGNAAEIARWREAIRSPNMDASSFSTLLRAEGWVSLGGFVIPAVNGDMKFPQPNNIPDPDALFDAYAQGYIEAANRSQTLSLLELLGDENEHLGFPIDATHLSKGSQELLEEIAIGASSWANGWVRTIVLSARTDAALAIMQGAEIPLEPFTGLPYVYDSVARTLQVPDDPRLREKLNIGDALRLP